MRRGWRRFFVALALWAQARHGLRGGEHDAPDDRLYVVGEILVDAHDIFDEEEMTDSWRDLPRQVLNAFHFVTREEVLAREILLRPGELYDPELAAESERNLRALDFIAEAKVIPVFRPDGNVDLRVVTRDRFTLRLSLGGALLGGEFEGSARLGESNLFGYGKVLKATATASSRNKLLRVKYQDPRLLGSRHRLELTGAVSDFGERLEMLLERPFYSRDVDWSWGGNAGFESGAEDFFEEGEEIERVPVEQQSLQLFLARAFGPRERRVKLLGSFEASGRRFGEPEEGAAGTAISELPSDRQTYTLSLSPQLEYFPVYLKRSRVDSIDAVEDIPLGIQGGPSAGVSYWVADESPAWQVPLGGSAAWTYQLPWLDQIGRASAGATWRSGGGETRAWTLNASWRHFLLDLLPEQTLAMSVAFDAGWDRDELPLQFTLGEESGLRGFEAHAFEGNKRLRFNFEDRIFTPVELYSVHLGAVAFFDSGFVWDRGEAVDLAGLKSSVGVGLRLGSARLFGRSVLRLDVGFPLDHFGSGISVSFASGQVFGLFGVIEELGAKF